MSYTLTIDQGNTRTKTTLFDEQDKIVKRGNYDVFEIGILLDEYDKFDISGIIYSSVSHIDTGMIETIRQNHAADLVVMTRHIDAGIGIDYQGIDTLGCDRIAGAAGAVVTHSSTAVLIADAGTAITLDIVDERGCFHGGNISAGVSLRLQALHENTGALPHIESCGDVVAFGYDTQTAMRSGAVMGAIWEIEGAFNHARKLYGCRKLLLTGGDAEMLAKHLSLPEDCVCIEPDLVAHGLNRILHINKNTYEENI